MKASSFTSRVMLAAAVCLVLLLCQNAKAGSLDDLTVEPEQGADYARSMYGGCQAANWH